MMNRSKLRTYAFAGLGILFLAAALMAPPIGRASGADNAPAATPVAKANYDLAARWTSAKVGKLVFDTAVTPHWMENDRFWYAYETPRGRRFYIVDPVKKTKAPVFDPAAMAALITSATGVPFDAQHLPIRSIRFINKETAIEFDVAVPRDAEVPGYKPPAEGTDTETQGQGGGQRGGQRGGQQGPAPDASAAPTKSVRFNYDLATQKLTINNERRPQRPRWAQISPNGKYVIFSRTHNLFLMDAENYAKALKKADDPAIVEAQLTKDGEEHFTYGVSATAQSMEQQQQQQQQEQQQTTQAQGEEAQAARRNQRSPATNITWAKDSMKFSLIRRDQRKVSDLWVINALATPRPTLETYRYAMPGEANIPQPQLEVFDPEAKSRAIVKTDKFKDQSIQIQTDRANSLLREQQPENPPPPQWVSPGSDKLYFTRMSRDLHKLDVCVLDTASGEVKPLIEERMNVYIETKPLRLVNNAKEMLFWSERDGWGHYYLYDINGTLKNRLTQGEFVTDALVNVDEKSRAAFIEATGREDGDDPYYNHLYRASLDGHGSAVKLLDPGSATHSVVMSDDARFFVDNSSRVDLPPVSVLYDSAGNKVLDLETTDVSALKSAGFKFPEPFSVKADDGITDLTGVMFKPFDFDPGRKYPIILNIYPGPQTESVVQTFSPRNANVMLANLGFIVIQVGNRGGNPHRSKWYHTYGYGNLRDYGLADKKAAVEQLSLKYSFIDINRVGIYGHSGGGFMTAAAMLIYPDFFKVGVSESGNHENNIYNNTWSEKHHGIKEVTDASGTHFEYSIDKNSEIAKNLKGHLLLSTGDIDNNVHPANTLRLVDALIKANKRFDFVVLPGQRHSYAAMGDWFNWTRADYFCRWLLGDWDQSVDMWELNNERQQNNRTAQPPQRGGQQRGGQRRGGE